MRHARYWQGIHRNFSLTRKCGKSMSHSEICRPPTSPTCTAMGDTQHTTVCPPLSRTHQISLQVIPNFSHRSSAKEAHNPRRLHPNSKQRRRETGPPKPSFSADVSDRPWYTEKQLARAKKMFPTCSWFICYPLPKTTVLSRESPTTLAWQIILSVSSKEKELLRML